MTEESARDERTGEPSHWDRLGEDVSQILDVRREVTRAEGPFSRFSGWVGRVLGSPAFFVILLLAHAAWIVLNLKVWPWEPIDPFPFIFLATIASVEAPFLSILILINQRRHQKIDEVREEIDLRVSLHAERQLSMLIRVIDEVRRSQGIDLEENDERIARLGQDLDGRELTKQVRHDIEEQRIDE